jgi:hypothetical protein
MQATNICLACTNLSCAALGTGDPLGPRVCLTPQAAAVHADSSARPITQYLPEHAYAIYLLGLSSARATPQLSHMPNLPLVLQGVQARMQGAVRWGARLHEHSAREQQKRGALLCCWPPCPASPPSCDKGDNMARLSSKDWLTRQSKLAGLNTSVSVQVCLIYNTMQEQSLPMHAVQKAKHR